MIASFALEVSGVDLSGDFEDAFYGAGCDDALIKVVDGVLYLEFNREAASFGQAMASAERDVERAGGKVVSVMGW